MGPHVSHYPLTITIPSGQAFMHFPPIKPGNSGGHNVHSLSRDPVHSRHVGSQGEHIET